MKKKQKIVVSVIIFLIVLFTSFGYAAVNTKLSISGEAYVRVEDIIRITSLKLSSITGGYETYNSKYSKNSTSMFVTLPARASATYEVEVTNKSSEDYFLKRVTSSNLNYSLIDTKVYDLFNGNSVKKFYIKITNNETITKDTTLNLEFEFVKDENPTIALNDLPSWNTKGDDYAITPTYSSVSDGSVKCKSNLNPELENVIDLKDLTTTGVHNITCTVTSNTGKTASVTKSTKITYDPYTATTLVTNGSFESGVSEWGNYSINDVSVQRQYMPNETSYGFNSLRIVLLKDAQVFLRAIFPQYHNLAGHKVYAKVSTLRKTTSVDPGIYLGFAQTADFWPSIEKSTSDWHRFHSSSIGQWVNVSIYNSNAPYNYLSIMLAQANSGNTKNGEFYFDGLVVVDLTETFGVGNEPNKTWCDKHIKYFDGTTIIYK